MRPREFWRNFYATADAMHRRWTDRMLVLREQGDGAALRKEAAEGLDELLRFNANASGSAAEPDCG